MIKNVSFPASKVSSIIGKNPFCKFDEIFDEMKCRITGDKVKSLNDTTVLNKEELLKLSKVLLPNTIIPEKDLNIETILTVSCNNAVKCDTTQESTNIENIIKSKIENILPNHNLTELTKFITTDINTKRGITNEDKIIQNYNKKYKTTITDNNSQLYKYPFLEINKNNTLYKFHISAKIDGLENGILIEIKNRRNRLFGKIPEYEKVQLEIYLRILNLDTAKLVENFNNTTNEHIYTANDELWNFIQENLYIFSHKLLDN
jgi:succinate dehydrogenase flavin-adding protein (antitoxin of CptAB toxin-antitoxin module)